jgi:hypothetical protein
MAHDAMSLLTKQIDEDLDRINQVLTAGTAGDFAEYKYLCGQVWGLSRALSYVKDMEQRLQRGEE